MKTRKSSPNQMYNVDFVLSYCDLKRKFRSQKWHEFLEEKPSLEMHKAYLREKSIWHSGFLILFFFLLGAMHKNSTVGFLLQLHEQIVIIFAAL